MDEHASPTRASMEQALRSLPDFPPYSVSVRAVDDISPRIGTSRVFRVFLQSTAGEGLPPSLILKIPDWEGTSLLDSRDPWLYRRERALFESGLLERLPAGIRAPAVLGIEERNGSTWIWMEDLGECLHRSWRFDDAIMAAQRSALLHEVYRQEQTVLTTATWPERDGYAAYAHHLPRAHQNLDHLGHHPIWSTLFSSDQIERLHRCLDLSTRAIAELRSMPETLTHGDFHIRNLGFDAAENLVCIDWAHVGLAPPGSDIAILTSLYRAFGGTDSGDWIDLDREVVAAYSAEIERLSRRTVPLSAINRAFVLWHVTWGLQVRLGPGLTYLLGPGSGKDTSANDSAEDIREGCERALFYGEQVAG